ncbi:unnamed protein product [Boreogadus saida]
MVLMRRSAGERRRVAVEPDQNSLVGKAQGAKKLFSEKLLLGCLSLKSFGMRHAAASYNNPDLFTWDLSQFAPKYES